MMEGNMQDDEITGVYGVLTGGVPYHVRSLGPSHHLPLALQIRFAPPFHICNEEKTYFCAGIPFVPRKYGKLISTARTCTG
jgi:hypothetical protein